MVDESKLTVVIGWVPSCFVESARNAKVDKGISGRPDSSRKGFSGCRVEWNKMLSSRG